MNTFFNSFLVLNILTLIRYSSEMNFMPNYNAKPDKLYLILPFIIFAFFYLLLLASWLKLKIDKKLEWNPLILLILSFLCLLNLSSSGNQIPGFIGTFIVTILIASFRAVNIAKNKNKLSNNK